MTRNLKALGLALVAVFAMGAVMASGASAAEGQLTAEEYPATISGENIAGKENIFTGAFGIEVKCAEAVYHGPTINGSAKSATAVPTYSGCTSGTRFATVTMNGCDYLLHNAQGSAGSYSIESDLDCETTGPGPVEVHIYNDEAHTQSWCTVKIDNPNTQRNLTGLNTTNKAGSPKDIELTGTATGIMSHAKGTCSFGLNVAFEGKLDTNVTLTGTNELGEAQGIDIG